MDLACLCLNGELQKNTEHKTTGRYEKLVREHLKTQRKTLVKLKKQILTFFYWAGLQKKVRKEDEGGEKSGTKDKEGQEEEQSCMGRVWESVRVQREWEEVKNIMGNDKCI